MPFVPLTLRILSADGASVILDCTEAAGYLVQAISPAGGRWRRVISTADDVKGHQRITEVLDTMQIDGEVLVRGSSTSQAITRANSLRNALWTPAYRLELGFDGVGETWQADRADVRIVREWQDHHNAQRRVTFTAPAQPETV